MKTRGLDGAVFEARFVTCPFCTWGHGWSGPPAARDPGQERLAEHLRERHPEMARRTPAPIPLERPRESSSGS